jgi:general secretion pathway protein J
MPRSIRGRAGFTLLEVLVAIVLLAVVFGAIGGTYVMAHRAADRGGRAMRALEEARGALELMRREIEAAVPGAATPLRVLDRDMYGERASTLEFTSFLSIVPGPMAMRYEVREGEGGLSLHKVVIPPDDGGAYRAEAREAEMIEGLKSFHVEAAESGDWRSSWGTEALPGVVRITLGVDMGAGRTLTLRATARPRVGRAL